MKVLGIETSCDETGLAIIEATGGLTKPRFKVIKNLVASQIKIHRPFGGVVPNLAKREHLKNLPILFKKLLASFSRSKVKSKKLKVDLIAVTVGPGLEPALWTGINFAKSLINADQNADQHGYISENQRRNLRISAPAKLVGANHLEGHLYSFLLPSKSSAAYDSILVKKPVFPAIALIVSGGHTILLYVESFSKWRRLGETRDDAAGEAFDKVARLLKLPYPGGPEIEKLAAHGNSFAITFPRPMLNEKNYDFSFSGLKTAVLYYLRDNPLTAKSYKLKANVAAGFEQAVVDVLCAKTRRAAEEYAAESILLSGGVAANKHLRKALKHTSELAGAQFFVPDFKYNLDNAAMIAAAGYFAHLRKKKYRLIAQGNLEIQV